MEWNHKRICCVYKAMAFNLRRPAKRCIPKRQRMPLYVVSRPNQPERRLNNGLGDLTLTGLKTVRTSTFQVST